VLKKFANEVEIVELRGSAFRDAPYQAQGPIGVLFEPSVRMLGGVST
jgi:hypothetical protein